MVNMKFRVKSSNHSINIQIQAHRFGIYFSENTRKCIHTDKPFLFLNWEDMSMTWDDNELRFEDSDHTETTLEELKAM